MKLRTALLLLCLMATLAGGSLVTANLLYEQGNVTIQVNHLYGDPLEAEGIQLAQTHVMDDRLQWVVDYNIWGEAQTQDVYYSGGVPYQYESWQEELQIYTPMNFGISSSGGTDGVLEGYNYNGLEEYPMAPAQDIAQRTLPGEGHTEEVYLADYYESYPLSIYFTGYAMIDENLGDSYQKIADYVNIPVPQDHLVEVTVEKDEQDVVRMVEMHSISGGIEVNGLSWLVLGQDYYFTLTLTDDQGNPVDHPLTQKIHKMTTLSENVVATHSVPVTGVAELVPVYTPPQGAQLMDMALDENESQILLLLEVEDTLVLQVLDLAFQEKQSLILGDLPLEYWDYQLIQGEDYLCVLENGGSFHLLLEGETGYIPAFSGNYVQHLGLEEKDQWDYLRGEKILAYQEGKLAIAFGRGTWNPNEVTFLTLFDERGCLYVGSYGLSLSQTTSAGTSWSQLPRRKDDSPIVVGF